MGAPSWVLLRRKVYFEYDAAASGSASEGESSGGAETENPRSKERRGPPSWQERADAPIAFLRTLKPDVRRRVADPPEISSLRVLRPTESFPWLCNSMISGTITSGDKNLVAICAGRYSSGFNSTEAYLVYNARSNSLDTIPGFPLDHFQGDLGCGAVVMCDSGGEGYVLAELITANLSDRPQALLYLWKSSSAKWAMKAAPFPIDGSFIATTCFSFRGSYLCWVDLFKGMLFCDLRSSKLEFRFTPLPADCPTYYLTYKSQERPQEFRAMAPCVGAAGAVIRFVEIDGYAQRRPLNEAKLTMWTLSPDFSEWKKGREYCIGDIWDKSKTITNGCSLGSLPKLAPMLPVLSMDRDEDVVYFICTDVRFVDGRADYSNGQYMLQVDLGNNKVQHYKLTGDSIHSQLFASEFSAYLQD